MAAPEVSGDKNIVKEVVVQDLSLVNFNDLSDKIETNSDEQMNHNIIKYVLIFLIGVSFLVSVVYKCIRTRRNRSRRQLMNEVIEMAPMHNRALRSRGMIPRDCKISEMDDRKAKKKKQRKRRRRNDSSEEEVEDKRHEKENRRSRSRK